MRVKLQISERTRDMVGLTIARVGEDNFYDKERRDSDWKVISMINKEGAVKEEIQI